MLSWAIAFLVIAIVAAALGFGGIAGSATAAAKIFSLVSLAMFMLTFTASRRSRL